MFSSQISLERSGVPRATEVLGQEFLDQISPEGHRIMFYLFRLESSVEFLFMSMYNMPLLEAVGMTPTGKNFTVATAFMCNEQAMTLRWVLQQIKRHIDQNMLAKLTEMVKDKRWLNKEDVDIFYRRLEIGSDIPEQYDRDMDSEMCYLTSLIHEISMGPISKIREVRRLIKGVISLVLPEDP
ncbi:hypothetical protein M9H77_25750 [Catharanthus roseus]|uniref:Uncharacterized protein n=1 Tax=Catharanthus roseus TaxID=4058 RepID=A0ACC0AAG0_CATRO|nr:hypothetical protein M9H77_25750 [Catharanthus roseus]